MGASGSKPDTETINWNNIKTENMSSSIPNFNGLSNDAKKLIASLNIPAITESPTSEFTVSHILDKISTNLNHDDQKKFNQLLDQVSSQTQDEELSATSPFISSEMYDYLIKNSEEQKGGAKKSKSKSKPKTKRGGAKLDDDSDTSSTSSDSEMEDLLDSTEEDIMKEKAKKDKKKHDKDNKHHKEESDSELSGGELSYLSSSAHTDGDYSDSQSNNHNGNSESSPVSSTTKSVESSSQTQTSEVKPKKSFKGRKTYSESSQNTVTDENNMRSTSISVNTEDINMVSDY